VRCFWHNRKKDKKDHYNWHYCSEEEHLPPSIIPRNESSGGESKDNADINGKLRPSDQLSMMSRALEISEI
jgi:hypothetical protein